MIKLKNILEFSWCDKDYGGIPPGGGFGYNTEYEVGLQTILEAAHCILGSIDRSLGKSTSITSTEAEHIAQEIYIIKKTLLEYGKPLYLNLQRNEFSQNIISNLINVSQKISPSVKKYMNSFSNLKDKIDKITFEIGMETYRFALMVYSAAAKTFEETHPKSAFRDIGVWNSFEKLDKLINFLTSKDKSLLTEAITDEQAKAAIDFLKEKVNTGPFKNMVYLAGGPVRDMIMGKTPKDIDLTIVSNSIFGALKFTSWLAKEMGNYKGPTTPPPTFPSHIEVDDYGAPKSTPLENDPAFIKAVKDYNNYYSLYSNPVVFPRFGTAKVDLTGIYNGVNLEGVDVEAVSARKEFYEKGNRKPIKVLPGTLSDDVFRRDFRCNSLMLDLTSGQIHDLTGEGINDIKKGKLVTTSDPEIIFREDPLRMLRAIRFMVQKGFSLSKETEENIKKNAEWLKFISRERIRDELDKIIVTKDPSTAFRKLNELGLLKYVSPELAQMIGMTQNAHHTDDVFDHTMAVLDKTPPELIRRRMALFHDIGKLVTRTVTKTGVHFYGHEEAGPDVIQKVMSNLKYPQIDIDAVKLGCKYHMKLKHGGDDASKLSDATLREFKIEMGEYLEHLLDVIHADNISHADSSTMPGQIEMVRQRLRQENMKMDKVTLPITGEDLIAMGIEPGPRIGKIMKSLRKAWYKNPYMTKQQALNIAKGIR